MEILLSPMKKRTTKKPTLIKLRNSDCTKYINIALFLICPKRTTTCMIRNCLTFTNAFNIHIKYIPTLNCVIALLKTNFKQNRKTKSSIEQTVPYCTPPIKI